MTDEYEKQWIWRGRDHRLENTLWDQILADLFVASPQREYWHVRHKNSSLDSIAAIKNTVFIYVKRLFDINETDAKEASLRRLFLWAILLPIISYLIESSIFGINNIIYITISAISAVSFYLIYERLYVPQALTIGVLGLCIAVPLVDFDLILFPALMLMILVLYLLARVRAR